MINAENTQLLSKRTCDSVIVRIAESVFTRGCRVRGILE